MSILENPMKYRIEPFKYCNADLNDPYTTITNDLNDPTITNDYNDMNVKKIIYLNNSQHECEYGGWDRGLNKINECKSHVARNADCYIQYAKKGKQNVGFLACSLILYYLETDVDFNTWYKIQNVTDLYRDYAP